MLLLRSSSVSLPGKIVLADVQVLYRSSSSFIGLTRVVVLKERR
jgi:hypothetical protein